MTIALAQARTWFPQKNKPKVAKYYPWNSYSAWHFKIRVVLSHLGGRIGVNEENITKTKGYIPNSIKLKLKENENIEKITLIIKNISVNETFENLKNILHGMFKKYGEINYIKLLKDHKTGNPKDIAFLEYYYSLDAIKLLESKERFIINNCILSISKSK